MDKLNLNLGSGGKKLEGFVNVDSNPMENPDVLLDIATQPWPWADNTVDGAVLSHVLEHIPGDGFFHVLRELYRVCKPDAIVYIVVPHPRHDVFLNDPTHCRVVTPTTLFMFSRKFLDENDARGAHYTPFARYHNVDFESLGEITYNLDPSYESSVKKDANGRVEVDDDLRWAERHMNNVVVEYHMKFRVKK